MSTVLKVKKVGKNQVSVSYPKDHPKAERIEKWLDYLSPGYIEYLLQTNDMHGPHCSACRDFDCENHGMGDDACPAFKYGARW
jgi:hypothetical protein